MNHQLALRYWNISIQYLHLAQHVSDEIVKHGNAWVVVGEPSPPDIDYFERTKWSDHMVAMPLLFNFYHGIELMLKGFATLTAPPSSMPTHKLSALASDFNAQYSNQAIANFLSKYLEINHVPGPLRRFLVESKISVDQYYQALKYPESNSGSAYMHHNLYYQSDWGVPFYEELRDDIFAARRAFVVLGRSFAPT